MQRNNNSIIWNPGELIYEIGSIPEEAYLILEGYVNIETQDQFKLNTLGKGEVFGESSLLLGTKRTVTARADSHKVVANIIPKDYFLEKALPEANTLSDYGIIKPSFTFTKNTLLNHMCRLMAENKLFVKNFISIFE